MKRLIATILVMAILFSFNSNIFAAKTVTRAKTVVRGRGISNNAAVQVQAVASVGHSFANTNVALVGATNYCAPVTAFQSHAIVAYAQTPVQTNFAIQAPCAPVTSNYAQVNQVNQVRQIPITTYRTVTEMQEVTTQVPVTTMQTVVTQVPITRQIAETQIVPVQDSCSPVNQLYNNVINSSSNCNCKSRGRY